jgi:hypothetical protein
VWGYTCLFLAGFRVLQLHANLRLQTMAPVKLPRSFKCRLFGSSRNSLGLGKYSIDHGKGRSTNSTPPGTPIDRKNVVAGEPSAMYVTVISSDTDGSIPMLPMCIEGSTPALPICIEGKNNIYASSTAPKKRKSVFGRYSWYNSNRQFQDVWAAKLPWAEPHLDVEGVLVAVNCKVCSAINGKPKLIVPKWDNLEKHMWKICQRSICQRRVSRKANVTGIRAASMRRIKSSLLA